MKFRLFLIEPQ